MRAILFAALACGLQAGPAAGDVGSDKPAAILEFPKLLVDTKNGLDTMIRISNVSDTALNVLCFYVNVTPRCTLPDGDCFPDETICPVEVGETTIYGECEPQWQPTDFLLRLTRDQPTGWLVSGGAGVNCGFLPGRCSTDADEPCDEDDDCEDNAGRCVIPPCLPLAGPPQGRVGRDGQINEGLVPVSPEDPFVGELRCIALDESLAPTSRNDLIGEVLIGRWERGREFIDVAGYNAIGIPAIEGKGNRDNTLILGGPTGDDPDNNEADRVCRENNTCAEYEGCPNILIVDHFFDGAEDPWVRNECVNACSLTSGDCEFSPDDKICSITGGDCERNADCEGNRCVDCFGDDCTDPKVCSVTGNACTAATEAVDCDNLCGVDEDEVCSLSGQSCRSDADCTEPVYEVRVASDLTLVPCTQDFESRNLDLSRTVAQFLVYNEFEQRFSTSRTVECFKETRLSHIDTRDGRRSIFSAGVAGTLTGQTRIRGALTAPEGGGNTLLGVLEEFRCGGPKYAFPTCDFVRADNLVSSAAKNLHYSGRRPTSDFLYLAPR